MASPSACRQEGRGQSHSMYLGAVLNPCLCRLHGAAAWRCPAGQQSIPALVGGGGCFFGGLFFFSIIFLLCPKLYVMLLILGGGK